MWLPSHDVGDHERQLLLHQGEQPQTGGERGDHRDDSVRTVTPPAEGTERAGARRPD